MSRLKMNLSKQKDEILAATAVPPKEGDFVWNGEDEDDRPLSKKEMREGIKRAGGRPRAENPNFCDFRSNKPDPNLCAYL